MHLYNPAFIGCQLDALWQAGGITNGMCGTDVCLSPQVSWMLPWLQQQEELARPSRIRSFPTVNHSLLVVLLRCFLEPVS